MPTRTQKRCYLLQIDQWFGIQSTSVTEWELQVREAHFSFWFYDGMRFTRAFGSISTLVLGITPYQSLASAQFGTQGHARISIGLQLNVYVQAGDAQG